MAHPLTHLTHGISTRRPFHPAKTGETKLRGDAIKASAQDLRIEVCRALFLDLSSSAIERHNEILIGPSAEKGNDGRLPIDEGSVHVKGYGVEIGKFQRHGFLVHRFRETDHLR